MSWMNVQWNLGEDQTVNKASDRRWPNTIFYETPNKNKKPSQRQCIMTHHLIPAVQRQRWQISLSLGPAYSTQWVTGQPRLHVKCEEPVLQSRRGEREKEGEKEEENKNKVAVEERKNTNATFWCNISVLKQNCRVNSSEANTEAQYY